MFSLVLIDSLNPSFGLVGISLKDLERLGRMHVRTKCGDTSQKTDGMMVWAI